MNGGLAALAGITPISGYANSSVSLVIGALCGLVSLFGMRLCKTRLRIDDALDVFSVHGLTGVLGSLSIGFAADATINPASANGIIYGGSGRLFGVQLLAVVFTLCWSAMWTAIILTVLCRVYGTIRVKETKEALGLDYSELEEVAYHDMHLLDSEVIRELLGSAAAQHEGPSGRKLPLYKAYRRNVSHLPKPPEVEVAECASPSVADGLSPSEVGAKEESFRP